jgi:hypothetical protein
VDSNLIAFIVSSFKYNNTGLGGHYYTAFSIYNEIAKQMPASLIVIGDLKPPAIDFSKNGVLFLKVSRKLLIKDFKFFYQLTVKLGSNILHAFDPYAFLFARMIGQFTNIKVFATKCGGPKPEMGYYPRICPDIIFSNEDQHYFKKRASLFNVPTPVLLPNRISSCVLTKQEHGIAKLPGIDDAHSIKIIRIARIYKAYEKSIFQTIELSRALRNRGLKVILYIVGYLQDNSVFQRVLKQISKNDYLLTEDAYTQNASRHLQHVDIVVASGRGVMEACYSGKIICCSVCDSDLPFILDADNFDDFFYHNFSSRTSKPNIDSQENIGRITELINQKEKLERYRHRMEILQKKYFDIATVIPTYLELYTMDRFKKNSFINLIDLAFHLLISIAKLTIREIQLEKKSGTERTLHS